MSESLTKLRETISAERDAGDPPDGDFSGEVAAYAATDAALAAVEQEMAAKNVAIARLIREPLPMTRNLTNSQPGRDTMPTTMRAKMYVESVIRHTTIEVLTMRAVARSGAYPEDGSDEDNTYARFSPAGMVELTVANPALLGKINPGEKYYLDFTPVEVEPTP